jgi:hypothetical protein
LALTGKSASKKDLSLDQKEYPSKYLEELIFLLLKQPSSGLICHLGEDLLL